jgi:hypothetical protein
VAIAAAAPGDVLLLQPGDYTPDASGFFITKGLTLMPAPAAGRITLGDVTISGLIAGQTVVLRGFDLKGTRVGASGLLVTAAAGTAWIEDCNLFGFNDPTGRASGSAAARVDGGHAEFRACEFRGGHGHDALGGATATLGGAALQDAAFSTVALHHCTLIGGDAGDGPQPAGSLLPPGSALDANLADVTLAACTLTGGAEGADDDAQPGVSASAIAVHDLPTTVRVLQSVLAAGAVQGLGTRGPAIEAPASAVQLLAEPARSLVLPALLFAGQDGTLVVDGEPGDLALLLLSTRSALLPLPKLEGSLALDPESLAGPIALGLLVGPDGELELPFVLGPLPPGVEATTVLVQGLFLDAEGASLGGASALTWIDAVP